MRDLYAIRTRKNHYKFINVKELKDDIYNAAFWVILIGMFLYCLFA